jgi:hypothetical protein
LIENGVPKKTSVGVGVAIVESFNIPAPQTLDHGSVDSHNGSFDPENSRVTQLIQGSHPVELTLELVKGDVVAGFLLKRPGRCREFPNGIPQEIITVQLNERLTVLQGERTKENHGQNEKNRVDDALPNRIERLHRSIILVLPPKFADKTRRLSSPKTSQ